MSIYQATSTQREQDLQSRLQTVRALNPADREMELQETSEILNTYLRMLPSTTLILQRKLAQKMEQAQAMEEAEQRRIDRNRARPKEERERENPAVIAQMENLAGEIHTVTQLLNDAERLVDSATLSLHKIASGNPELQNEGYAESHLDWRDILTFINEAKQHRRLQRFGPTGGRMQRGLEASRALIRPRRGTVETASEAAEAAARAARSEELELQQIERDVPSTSPHMSEQEYIETNGYPPTWDVAPMQRPIPAPLSSDESRRIIRYIQDDAAGNGQNLSQDEVIGEVMRIRDSDPATYAALRDRAARDAAQELEWDDRARAEADRIAAERAAITERQRQDAEARAKRIEDEKQQMLREMHQHQMRSQQLASQLDRERAERERMLLERRQTAQNDLSAFTAHMNEQERELAAARRAQAELEEKLQQAKDEARRQKELRAAVQHAGDAELQALQAKVAEEARKRNIAESTLGETMCRRVATELPPKLYPANEADLPYPRRQELNEIRVFEILRNARNEVGLDSDDATLERILRGDKGLRAMLAEIALTESHRRLDIIRHAVAAGEVIPAPRFQQ